jgi:hypothetical protein
MQVLGVSLEGCDFQSLFQENCDVAYVGTQAINFYEVLEWKWQSWGNL